MTQHIYILSGLGADHRLFSKLEFKGCEVQHLIWVLPQQNESIQNYARRLLQQIHHPQPILIGLSFGGIMAIEIAKLLPVKKLILLASAKTKYDIPWYYRTAGCLRLHKVLPASVFKRANTFTYWLFGVESAEEKHLLKQILQDTNPQFMRWAIHQIVSWQNAHIPEKLVHIHGSADRLLPCPTATALLVVKNAGHFFTLNKANELNELLDKIINSDKTPT